MEIIFFYLVALVAVVSGILVIRLSGTANDWNGCSGLTIGSRFMFQRPNDAGDIMYFRCSKEIV